MPSSSDYTIRILDEAQRVIDPRVSALQSAFEGLRSHLLTSIEQLTPKLDALKSIDLPAAERIVSEAMKEAAWQNQVEVNLLAEFAGSMRRRETQEEILSLLLDTAHQFTYAAALFVARGDEIAGWSSRGFSAETAARLGSSSFASTDSAILRKALGSETVVTFGHPPDEFRLQEIFKDEPLVSWHLLPMRALQRPIAILAACDSDERRSNLDSLRILMDFTSLCVENLALKILQEMRTAETAAPETASQPPAEPSRPAEAEAVPAAPVREPEPEPISAEPPAPAPAPLPVEVPGRVELEESLKEIPLFAEPAPESQAAETTAALADAAKPAAPSPPQEPVEPHVAAKPAPSIPGAPVAAAPPAQTVPLGAEVEKLHADARRFARLLVSEIKLYNEQRLLEARAGGQIYLRLKRDIDRSREMYEKRFPTFASHKVDYFHDEIVRILAENDTAKLGAEYPGPRVES